MARCEDRHPKTHKRCVLEAGHPEEHEEHTAAEREAIACAMADDGIKLVTLWTKLGYPPPAISAGILAVFFSVQQLRQQPERDTLRQMLSCLANRDLSDHEIFVFCAELLGVSCEVMKIGDQKTAS